MSEIKRYDLENRSLGYEPDYQMYEESDGDWVCASDYDQLRQENEALRQRCEQYAPALEYERGETRRACDLLRQAESALVDFRERAAKIIEAHKNDLYRDSDYVHPNMVAEEWADEIRSIPINSQRAEAEGG